MKYRVTQSNQDGRYVVYRKFHYKPSKYLGVKGFASVFLLSLGIFVTIPTPEDIVILGTIGKYVSSIFGMSTGKGILFATLAYKGAGIAILCVAVVLGGSYVQEKLKAQVKSSINSIGKLHL